jgi:hypothetical protein
MQVYVRPDPKRLLIIVCMILLASVVTFRLATHHNNQTYPLTDADRRAQYLIDAIQNAMDAGLSRRDAELSHRLEDIKTRLKDTPTKAEVDKVNQELRKIDLDISSMKRMAEVIKSNNAAMEERIRELSSRAVSRDDVREIVAGMLAQGSPKGDIKEEVADIMYTEEFVGGVAGKVYDYMERDFTGLGLALKPTLDKHRQETIDQVRIEMDQRNRPINDRLDRIEADIKNMRLNTKIKK